ncbi:GroES-like protein [Trichoderma ceciliae]
MAIPQTYKAYHRTTGDLPLTVVQSSETTPKDLGANNVLVKIHSVSLNYRDVAMLHGAYPAPVLDNGIPASDCAAEVVAVGSAVRQFKAGDAVSPNFFVNYLTGSETEPAEGLGGNIEGVLGEYAAFPENTLVRLPDYLSWDEASTIACAGVTAWTSTDGLKNLSPESSYVLLEGTGGVSMFALLLLIDAGIKTIITSSSDAKIAQIEKLSPLVTGVNYKAHPIVSAEVWRITNGRGVDIVVNNIGPGSIPSNIESIRHGGSIAIVGFLGGVTADWNPSELIKLMFKRGVLRGITVGTKIDFEALCAHLAKRKIGLQPLVDRVFAFDEAKDAFDYMYEGRHVGKVIIKVAD